MNKLVGSPHTICVRYRQIMEEVMIEIIGVKEGSEVKKGEVEGLEMKGGREAGEEGRIPVWRLTLVSLVLLRLRQEDQRFKASPSYTVKACHKTNKKMINKLERVNISDVKSWNIKTLCF